MSNKVKKNACATSAGDFDWSIYEDGWNGAKLKNNKKVVVPSTGDKVKVFCHEKYAQDMVNSYFNVPQSCVAKDDVKNSVHYISDIYPVSSTEVIVDTPVGGSFRIDLNKEKEYIAMVGCNSVEQFVNSLSKSATFKKNLMKMDPNVKVLGKNRISLYAGHCAKIENEFRNQITNPTTAYYAHIDSINGGGYIVTIEGVKAFLPGSLAQTNKILDYNVLIGKTIPVMIDSYLPNQGFVVSYKKYLKTILPQMIEKQLSVGMAIDAEVTGVRKNNVFLQFADLNNSEDMIYTGLLPWDNCCDEIRKDIENGQFKPGSKWRVYIYAINEDGNGGYRIVFCDRPLNEMPTNESKENDTTEVVDAETTLVLSNSIDSINLTVNVDNNTTVENSLVAKIG